MQTFAIFFKAIVYDDRAINKFKFVCIFYVCMFILESWNITLVSGNRVTLNVVDRLTLNTEVR